MANSKTILVAPLNWGLGHATRCIPIIRALLKRSFKVVVASDGAALELLRKEFPFLPFIELPSYDISYPKNGRFFKLSLLLKIPYVLKTMRSEEKLIEELVSEEKISGIISDNRFGVHHHAIPSVYITHQLNVLSGRTTPISSKLHQSVIKKFDACWVPDFEGAEGLSGDLSNIKPAFPPITYLGILSRMQARTVPKKYDILAIISGPEPQRTIFEKKVIDTLRDSTMKTLVVRGVVEKEQKVKEKANLTLVNYMQSADLEQAINQSAMVISRSGYTTIMDLSAMGKKVFFVPTPGQYEQLYLAQRMHDLGKAPYCEQADFSIAKLKEVSNYKGLSASEININYDSIFRLFEGE